MRGANFELGNEIPVDLHITSVEAAKKALDAHMAKSPGDYRRCAEAGTLDERRAWLLKRDLLEMDVELAEKSFTIPPTRAPKAKRARESPLTFSPVRKTVEDFLEMIQTRILEMSQCEPRSKAWSIAHASARNYRLRLIERAEMDGVPVPEIPVIPGIPEDMQIHTGRKQGSIVNPHISEARRAKERERDRRRRMASKKAVDSPMGDVESGRGGPHA